MKHILLLSLFLLLPFLGCNNESPTSPEETVEKTEQTTINQPNQTQSIIITLPPVDWSNIGKPITHKQAITMTNNYTKNVYGVQNIPISRTICEQLIVGRNVKGVSFYFAKTPTGKFTVVSIPADLYGRRIPTSTTIACENVLISYVRAQQLTNNFSYKIGTINGRMTSIESIQNLLAGNTTGIWLHFANDANGNLTFVLANSANPNTSSSNLVENDYVAIPPQ